MMLSTRARSRLALAATQVLCEGSSLLRNLLLARLIGVEQMGLAVALALAIRALEMFSELGADRLLVQVEEPALPGMRGTVHLVQLIKGCALAAIAAALAGPIAMTLNADLDPAVITLAALAFVIRGLVNADYRERQRHQQFAPALVVEGGSNLIAALLVAPLAWLYRDYTALAWSMVLQSLLMCALSRRVATQRYSLRVERAALRRLVSYGLPLALNGALLFIAMQGDRLVAALYFPADQLARFAIAAQLTLLPALIGARYLLAAWLPEMARQRTEPEAFRRHHAVLLCRTAVVAGAGAVLFGIWGNLLIGLLYGAAFLVTPELLWPLALAAAVRLLRAVPGTALLALERTRLLFASNLPRVLTVALACGVAADGGDLAAIALIALAGETASLAIALIFVGKARGATASARPQLALEMSR